MADILSISEIKKEYSAIKLRGSEDIALIDDFVNVHQEDERSGVKTILKTAMNKREAFRKELDRVESMHIYEKRYSSDYSLICGIDEVGRGPLAGPVCAAAVILKPDARILYINDSKKLSEKKREELYDEIMDKSLAVGISLVDSSVIDEVNILNATYIAMRDAISKLELNPDLLLVDAVNIPDVDIKQVSIIKGDAKSASIAAASIVAKVTRDRLMDELGAIYPEYGFESHKGYGTAKHYAAIEEYGVTEIHRRSFLHID